MRHIEMSIEEIYGTKEQFQEEINKKLRVEEKPLSLCGARILQILSETKIDFIERQYLLYREEYLAPNTNNKLREHIKTIILQAKKPEDREDIEQEINREIENRCIYLRDLLNIKKVKHNQYLKW